MITLPIWLLIMIGVFGLPLLVGIIYFIVMYIKTLILLIIEIIKIIIEIVKEF